jgi:hypothetical protein
MEFGYDREVPLFALTKNRCICSRTFTRVVCGCKNPAVLLFAVTKSAMDSLCLDSSCLLLQENGFAASQIMLPCRLRFIFRRRFVGFIFRRPVARKSQILLCRPTAMEQKEIWQWWLFLFFFFFFSFFFFFLAIE